MIHNMLIGLDTVLDPMVILGIMAGAMIGYFVGAMPGLTPTVGVALLVPFTFGMDPVVGLTLLGSLYMGAEYGGGITAILLNTPGTPSAAATAFDGYPLAQQGQVGRALGISIISSGIGSFFSTIMLILFTLPLAKFALTFGPPEYMALALFGLTVVSGLAGNSWIKALIMVTAGLLVTTVGIDPITGVSRYVYTNQMMEGIALVPALLGLFAVSEVFLTIEEPFLGIKSDKRKDVSSKLPSKNDLKSLIKTLVRSTGIGYVIGMIPGAGATIASFISYNEAKRNSKKPETFGKGNIEGICASEAANNSAVAGAIVPLLTLGLPGSSTTAIMLGALTIQGLQPGPFLFLRNPDVVYGFFWALIIGVPIMTAIGILGIKFWVKIIQLPKFALATVILCISILGAYSLTNSMYSVWICFAFGIIGFILRKADYSAAPMVLAIVLGKLLESNFRRSLMMSKGDLSIFFTRPVTVGILLLSCLVLLAPILRYLRKKSTETLSN